MDESHSITRLISQLKKDDLEAAEGIWQRYFQRLLPLARAKLRSMPSRVVDEEDILISVFDRFFNAVREGRFAKLHDRDDLLQILVVLTERKVVDQYRRANAEKRGGQRELADADLPQMDVGQIREIADKEPGPEFVAAFNENLAWALNRLSDDSTCEVALLRLEGYSNKEISKRLDISLRTVERKLRVIRDVWGERFDPSGSG